MSDDGRPVPDRPNDGRDSSERRRRRTLETLPDAMADLDRPREGAVEHHDDEPTARWKRLDLRG